MLQVSDLSFSYSDSFAINKLNFSIKKGTILAVIGESGCGKSTLLKLIYGLYDLNHGAIMWNEKQVLGPKFQSIPGTDWMKYLAQDFDLMPFTTVAENIGSFLTNTNLEKKQQRILDLLQVVQMEAFEKTKVKSLSGGQMQRVALAKALAFEPEVLLLDEPFSHIDNFLKNRLRRKLFAYLKQNQITTLMATHDVSDVLSFADEVLVMKNGEIHAHDSPLKLYQNPKSKDVAALFDEVNEFEIDGTLHYIYPHQLKKVQKSSIKAKVLNHYFRGAFYLIEVAHQNKSLFFNHPEILETDTFVYLQISKTV